jgi:RNA polymerase sigma-70 factor (ECF subfamily)
MALFETIESAPLSRHVAEARFARLYAENGRDVFAYALPRTASVEDAAEVVAETFLVAWRRAIEVPHGPQARFWLLGVARQVVANQRRGEGRGTHLAEVLQAEPAASSPAQPGPDSKSRAVLRALERLGAEDRELLLLAGWEELSSAQIARVLGISTPAARTRLHRARRRLRKQLGAVGGRVAMNRSEELRIEEA